MTYETLWNKSAKEIITLQDGSRMAAPRIFGTVRPDPAAIVKDASFSKLVKDGQKLVHSGKSPVLLRYADKPGRPQERLISLKDSVSNSLGGKAKAEPTSKVSSTTPDQARRDSAPLNEISKLVKALQDHCQLLQQKLDGLTEKNDALQKTVVALENEVKNVKGRMKYVDRLETRVAEIIERSNQHSKIIIPVRNICRQLNGDPEDPSYFKPLQD